jgi:hypothetical protein
MLAVRIFHGGIVVTDEAVKDHLHREGRLAHTRAPDHNQLEFIDAVHGQSKPNRDTTPSTHQAATLTCFSPPNLPQD